MIAALPLSWKLAGAAIGLLLIGLALGGIYVKGRSDGAAQCAAEQAQAIAKAQKQADDLADQLAVARQQAMAVTENKAVSYVDRIKMVPTPPKDCASDERMRIGSEGVRDLILGGGSK